MTNHPRTRALLLSALVAAAAADASAAGNSLRVLVTGVQPGAGQIVCALFSESDGFPLQLERASTIVRYPASAELMTCTFPGVEAGRFAITVVQDENDNREADDRLFGGREPWGVSRNARPPNRAPRFAEAASPMPPDRSLDLEIALKR